MNRTGPMTRREFIKAGSLAGTGLALGFVLPDGTERLLPSAPESGGPFAPNAWLRIDTGGNVTILTAKSDMGQGVRTALPMIVAEELEADWSKVRVEQAVADSKYGSMGTGGSTSIRTSWEPLRKAGATAREMLLAAAALTWKVDKSACHAQRGTIIHAPTGRTLTYGELAEKAAALPIPQEVPLKNPGDFKIIGRRMTGLDTPAKVDGSAVFGIDVRVPGMLYASIARCPVFGSKVSGFDAASARGMRGVRDVVQVDSGIAVIGDSTWAALQGRAALRVTWNEGENAHLSSEGIRSLFLEAAKKPGAVAEREGDVQSALGAAVKRISAVYEAPFLAHATMEPMNCTASVQKDRCEVWAPTQSPQSVRREAARISALPEEKVIVHTTLLGGGFGRRFETDVVTDALQTSKAISAPVKVTWTREDDMQHDWYRPASYHLLEGGIDIGGALSAMSHKIVAPSITGQQAPEEIKNGLDEAAVEGAVKLPYSIPNMLVEYVMANTGVPIRYWRSVYPSQNVFAVECFIDELAVAAGRDPVEFRLRMVNDSPRMKHLLELAAEKAGWGKPLLSGHFHGVAFSPPAFFKTPVVHIAEISVDASKRIRVHRVVCAIDCGIAINPDGIHAQMEGGIVFGLTAALHGRITIERGIAVQSNFDDYPLLTIDQMPLVEVHIVKSNEAPTGTGEPGLPAIAPAVANALFAATGKRVRSLPLRI